MRRQFFRYYILITLILTLISPSLVLGLSQTEVAQIAKVVSVRIDGEEDGSGVIVDKQGKTYTVLTNCHVIDTPGSYTLILPDQQQYQLTLKDTTNCHPKADLALLKFNSDRKYTVVTLGNSTQVGVGMTIYVSGWVQRDKVSPDRGYRFKNGIIEGIQTEGRNGYTLVHSAESRPGMSGGAIFDENGRLVGINGQAFADPNVNVTEFFGIPISLYTSWTKKGTSPVATVSPNPSPSPSPTPPLIFPNPSPSPQTLPSPSPALISSGDPPTLISAVTGVNYTSLRNFLASGKWQEADKETSQLMLQAIQLPYQGYFDTDRLESFACEDLRLIDQLWLKYSNGRFGFSIQQRIWAKMGSPSPDSPLKDWRRLYIAFGWKKGSVDNDKDYVPYLNYEFNPKSAPEGHLPWGIEASRLEDYVKTNLGLLLQRVSACDQ